MLNKADKLADSICSSSDSKVYKLFKKRYEFQNSWEGNWLKKRPTIEDLEPILDDTYWMLSIYREINEMSSMALSKDIEEGRINLLPYIYYSKNKNDADYIKRLIKKEKKVQEIKDAYEIDAIENTNLLEMPWKEEVNKISDEFLSNPENNNTNDLILDKDTASEMLEHFSRQSFESLERIKDKQFQKLQNINKELYTTVCRCVNEREKELLDEPYHKDSFAIFTGLLKWLIEPLPMVTVSMTSLYDLDKEIFRELAGTDVNTVEEATIWDLNSLRKSGAETCFKLHLIAYTIDCKENAHIPTINKFNYNDSLIPAHSINNWFDKQEDLNAESTARAGTDTPSEIDKEVLEIISKIARRRSNKKDIHSFDVIRKTLTTYYQNQESTYEKVKNMAEVDVGSSTYSIWKRELDEELK